MSKQNTGIGFTSLLLLIFITLKLCKVIEWSWWWVMGPVWIPLAAAIVLWGIGALLSYLIPEEESAESETQKLKREIREQIEKRKTL